MSETETLNKKKIFLQGVRDGMPICIGYFAVAFSLGIAARNAGISAFQGFLMSLLNNASAGEYALITTIAADAPYLEAVIITLVANARYLLMSTALSQRFSPDTPMVHRLCVSYDITDELFGIAIAREGNVQPLYSYGAFAVAIPGWAFGTAFGILMGNMLPANIVSALSVALYGMFLAIIIPPAKKDKIVGVLVLISFAASYIASRLPVIGGWSEGTRIILLTVVIAGAAAVLFPRKEETGSDMDKVAADRNDRENEASENGSIE
ncbi:MAG: AzlC family ABC transporter permease [Lachnospiraceae bacterium]|nr:AzlC family ABC transporter permease [Lachnospiraceae bacterium]